MSKLKLKPNIQKLVDQQQNVKVRLNGQFNKMEVFPWNTLPSEYMEYRAKGFRIFLCSECGREYCKHLNKDFRKEEVIENEKTIEDIVFSPLGLEDEKLNEVDYNEYTLKELREMFPDIKSVSKEGFINQIK